jgi:large repetitive protein
VIATSFTVNSDTTITATVPAGATTGKIIVKTPAGKATSPTKFTVT